MDEFRAPASTPRTPDVTACAVAAHAGPDTLEEARLAELYALDILDTPPEAAFDRIMTLAARYFRVPFGSITFVDRERQWFKAAVGFTHREDPIADSICALTTHRPGVLVIEDALKDERASVMAGVRGEPHIRFYAGAPLLTEAGHSLGTLCVIDQHPRTFGDEDVAMLEAFAQLACSELRLRRATRLLGQQALLDSLTGLPNRRAFHHRLDATLATGERCVVGLLDLDGFKGINDRYGHEVGDNALRFLSACLRALLRAGESVARYGGDEFTLLITGTDSWARVHEVAQALAGRLAAPDAPLRGLRASIGLAMVTGHVQSDDALRAADRAMYTAKAAGGGVQMTAVGRPDP
ncbi:sensor domain-containing diguanylate cyclase [Deinococcus sp.]|uniref:sensor domain-containing diguanylate cyclase n=1 Tax=Deinococcus sp. TaxID=47478 RepID=UPI002869A973|nr:sensor domain-containing diguanylate cyclase [Deinococcus sp.]